MINLALSTDAEQALVAANRLPLCRTKAKVKAAIDRVWGSASGWQLIASRFGLR